MTGKIRILQLIDQLGDAGAERLINSFALNVDRSQFDLHVCALRHWPFPKIVPDLRALGFPVTELNQRHAYDLHVLLSLVNYIRRNDIDIIHTHLLASDVMGRLAGFITRRPVVSTIHNGRTDLDNEPLHRQWMERWTARLWCRRLLVVSALLRTEIAAWFGFPLSKVTAIPNGVDTSRFAPPSNFDPLALKQDLVGGDYRIVANVARLVPQKGQSYLMEAAAIVARTRPDVRFVIVSDGELRDAITAQAASLGIADKLVITGLRTDVTEILAASDLFVLSSLWEGMPLSLIEAMSVGVPAVATDVGGVGQLLKDGVTGLLVPPADSQALAAAIARSLDHPAAARSRASTAKAMVLREFDIGTMVRRWEAVYKHELARPSKKRRFTSR
jgi:glycosyltransferase involved in cell wall biosynthesis